MGAASPGSTGELQGRLIQRCEVACYKGITFHLLCVLSRFLGSPWVGIPEPGWNSGCLRSWISAGSLRDQQRAGGVGARLGGWEMLKSNRLAKTKRGEKGGPLQTFLVSLYSNLQGSPRYSPTGPEKRGCKGLEISSRRGGERAPFPKCEPTPALAASALSHQ